MRLTATLAAGAIPATTAALTPRAVDCDFSTTADAGDTCSSFASNWGLSVDNLKQLNPGISCPDLDASKSYCVIGTVTEERSSTTSTSTTTKPTTTSKSTTTTVTAPSNSPTMPGVASNCDGFYQVSSGDQCDTIAAKYGISEAQFKSWNSQVDTRCSNLWLDYYPAGPTPQMPGIVSNCKKYHLIADGDSCYSINTAAKITLAQPRTWNTQVDASCSNLWLGYYVCVGV
ncbi:hypothetical protein N7509_014024 [Penicillium cosmopolitanum]|uniref:LysM domain-containing protein n=1 Tax=Penicillium cosmopolitanum TaxID=1131564 RepID=A0A9W9RZS6_9EURO|nr:uncharacterized protein N7509_014024 [Penicillium cosmopolitanum]KAJ5369412.1 hypothetical protein N7509_014024 [Penicillium cosmopolitanum]